MPSGKLCGTARPIPRLRSARVGPVHLILTTANTSGRCVNRDLGPSCPVQVQRDQSHDRQADQEISHPSATTLGTRLHHVTRMHHVMYASPKGCCTCQQLPHKYLALGRSEQHTAMGWTPAAYRLLPGMHRGETKHAKHGQEQRILRLWGNEACHFAHCVLPSPVAIKLHHCW